MEQLLSELDMADQVPDNACTVFVIQHYLMRE